MKEEYVTYEQAVKLKELGFSEKGNHGCSRKIRIEPNLSYGYVKEVHSKEPKNYNDNRKGAGKGLFFYSAPRIDQAAAWLREVKGTIVYPEPGFYKGKRPLMGYGYHIYDKDNGSYCHVESDTIYDSYELALSAGIDKALELLTLNTK